MNNRTTPPEIVDAIHRIAVYLRDCKYEQVIISHTGGATFRLTDIYAGLLKLDTAEEEA